MPAPEPGTIEHPPWCDMAHCTAKPYPASGQYGAGNAADFGAHASLPLPAGGSVTLQLTMAIAPWRTSTYLNIHDENASKYSSFYMAPGVPVDTFLGALVNLLGGIHADACPEIGPHRAHTNRAHTRVAGAPVYLQCPGNGNHTTQDLS